MTFFFNIAEMSVYIKNLKTYQNLTAHFNVTSEKIGKDVILYYQGENATLPGGLLAVI